MYKLGVLIPTKKDRPEFLRQAKEMLLRQTIKPYIIRIFDDDTGISGIDLNIRYRLGLTELFNKGCDVVALWEDDDWYHPEYLETMLNGWVINQPTIYGTSKTIYYHLLTNKYVVLNHPDRCSAMNMLVTRELLDYDPPEDNDKDFDYYYCQKVINKVCVTVNNYLSLGIKHGIGLCGGVGHNAEGSLYRRHGIDDKDMKFLKKVTGNDFKFYQKFKYEN